MNKTVKNKWIEALRSGEYEQGICSLRKDNKYCCLGVLCDLYGKENDTPWVKYVSEEEFRFLGHNKWLPKEVRDWAGVDYNRVSLPKCIGDRTDLVQLNDSGCSFDYIADVIEEQF